MSSPSARTGEAAVPEAHGSLWRYRDFMLLWSGQTVSEVGSSVTMLALPLGAVVLLKAGTFQVGLLTSATTLAFAVIALPAGALVDRRPKRGVMLACDAVRVLIIASVPLAWAAGALTLAQLYVVAVAAGTCTVFFDVSYQSYLPALLKQEHLIDGNGKLGASQSLAQLLGPGLGGGLVGAFGVAGAMGADAASYAVSIASLLAIRHREPAGEPRASKGASEPGLRTDIAEGLTFVTGHPILRKVVACSGTSNLFSSAAIAVDVIFLVRVLHVRPAYTGLVFSGSAIGGIAGGVLARRLSARIGSARIIWFSVLVFGAPQVLAALATPGWGAVLFSAGWGCFLFAIVVYNVAQVSYRQAICPPHLMGRMNAAVRWIVWGTMPLGGVIGGALGTAIGVRPTLAISLVGSWAAGFWVYFSPLRRLRDIPSSDRASPRLDDRVTFTPEPAPGRDQG